MDITSKLDLVNQLHKISVKSYAKDNCRTKNIFLRYLIFPHKPHMVRVYPSVGHEKLRESNCREKPASSQQQLSFSDNHFTVTLTNKIELTPFSN